jgi:hypothetical protein
MTKADVVVSAQLILKVMFNRQKIISPFVCRRRSRGRWSTNLHGFEDFLVGFVNYHMAICRPHTAPCLSSVMAGRDLWSSGEIKKSLQCFLLISQSKNLLTSQGLHFSGASTAGYKRDLVYMPSTKRMWL